MVRLCGILLCLLCSAWARGDDVLVAWEFNTEGDTEGWFPAHSLAPFTVEGGVLRTRITGPDPYMHASAGHAFDIEANDFQYIEIRVRLGTGGGAEFFWANTVEGRDAGFVAGKERGFSCASDGQWHVYHLYPLWQGKVTRLRFDPPEGAGGDVEIDYIRIMQGPRSEHDPSSAVWDFGVGNGGWVASCGGTHLASSPQGAQTELLAESLSLVGPPLRLKAEDYSYAFVQLQAGEDLTATLSWSATDEANFPSCNMVSFDIPAGRFASNLKLAGHPLYAGEIRRLSLVIYGPVGAKVTLQRLALSDKPLGAAQLHLVAFQPQKSLVARGREGVVVARVENRGGEPLRNARLSLTASRGTVELTSSTDQLIEALGPGQMTAVIWPFRAIRPGTASFAVRGEGVKGRTTVVVSDPFPPPRLAGVPSAQVVRNAAWICNDRVALTLVMSGGGFAGGRLEAVCKATATPMAVLPYLAALSLAGDQDLIPLCPQRATASQNADGAALKLTGEIRLGQAIAALTVTFTIQKAKSYIDATYELSADKDLRITGFRGPWLWAGEGSFGDQQDMALFPGLEYLEAGEKSSSTLDIAPPNHVRFAPHPNMVTVPTMAVEKGGGIIGLMWDPLQRWDGEHQKPTAVFASPNFVEGRANHLLGLFVPSIPEWVSPNRLVADRPYELKAGRPLTLAATLFAESGSEVLRSLDLYFDRYGLPELPPKPRSYEETVAMCLKSYEEVLWREEAQGWMGVVGWTPGRDQAAALNYTLAARRLQDREWAQKLTDKGLALGQPSDLGFALHHFGSPCAVLTDLLADGRVRARSAPQDGKYTFQPDEQRRSLGSPGATASGICADQVRPMLLAALRTGDQAPLEAALQTLKFMEQFRVPRASQVWEVPVHTPDILAAGNVAAVYLMGYQLTGDRELLKRAVYWAKTGLPFVYMWQAPDQKPLMKGASIPVFGASFYTGSWFGRPVQWNGLAYAATLLELARYDDSLPWKHFAELITISAMNQQSTRPHDYGTYTDNWDVVKDLECTVCMLAPGGILGNVLELLGAPVAVRTEVVRSGESRLSITSATRLSDARWEDGILEFGSDYDAGHIAYTAVMALAEPTQVEVDGAELAKRPPPIQTHEGWSYQPDLGCLTLKLNYGKGPRHVRIVKAKAITAKLPAPSWEFNRDGDAQGWVAANDVKPLTVSNGKLHVEVTGGDPYIISPTILADAKALTGVAFRAKVSVPNGQLFFASDKGGFAEVRSRVFELPADGLFHEVRLDLSDHEQWTSTIRQIRLDFAAAPCTVEIDWIRLLAAEKPTEGQKPAEGPAPEPKAQEGQPAKPEAGPAQPAMPPTQRAPRRARLGRYW